MLLFVDTSALVKLYVDEPGSGAMAARAREAPLAASALAYAEIHATFARRRRESLATAADHAALVQRFERDWRHLVLVPVRDLQLERVTALVAAHPLRGADALHLASALTLADAGLDVTFVCADRRLNRAAGEEGLAVIDPTLDRSDSDDEPDRGVVD